MTKKRKTRAIEKKHPQQGNMSQGLLQKRISLNMKIGLLHRLKQEIW